MLRLVDDSPIATTPAALRTIARVVMVQGEERGLVAFGTADDHLHAVLLAERATVGAFARYVKSALGWRLNFRVPFERARIRLLQDQRHAYNAVRYVHRQDSHHTVNLDHARDGTSLPDWLGLRFVSRSFICRVRMRLPRLHRDDLVQHFPPETFDECTPIGLDDLAESAAAAFALRNLRGRSHAASLARRAAVHAAGQDVASRVLADCLGISLRAVQVVRALERHPAHIRAVEGQARLRSALRNSVGRGAA